MAKASGAQQCGVSSFGIKHKGDMIGVNSGFLEEAWSSADSATMCPLEDSSSIVCQISI